MAVQSSFCNPFLTPASINHRPNHSSINRQTNHAYARQYRLAHAHSWRAPPVCLLSICSIPNTSRSIPSGTTAHGTAASTKDPPRRSSPLVTARPGCGTLRLQDTATAEHSSCTAAGHSGCRILQLRDTPAAAHSGCGTLRLHLDHHVAFIEAVSTRPDVVSIYQIRPSPSP